MSIYNKFNAAVNVINSLPKDGPFQPSEDMALKFEAYFNQATKGPCKLPKPSFCNHEKQKWYAWKNLEDMPMEVAMERYVDELSKVIETMSYTEAVSNFMDVIGPFYEIVSDDEDCANYSPNHSNYSGFVNISKDTSEEALELSKKEPTLHCEENVIQSENILGIHHVDLYYDEGWDKIDCGINSCSIVTNIQNTFRSAPRIAEFSENVIAAQRCCSVITEEIVASSILHLQKSLDKVVKHLDILEGLAKSYVHHQQDKVWNSEHKKNIWKSTPLFISLIFIWPFVANWLYRIIKYHLQNRSHSH